MKIIFVEKIDRTPDLIQNLVEILEKLLENKK